MLSTRYHLAEDYFNGQFRYSDPISLYYNEKDFAALHAQFSTKYDDFYHPYFKKMGDAANANKALIRIAFNLFLETHGHLPLAYKNCAISSGTWAHQDAVAKGYHTTDRLSRIIGSDWHGRTIKDNSQRSLERIERIRDLFIEVFFIGPAMFEGSTRAFSKGFGRHLTSLPFQAEEYMAFWNMVIDQCKAFILDDVRLDMPDITTVEREIDLAKRGVSSSFGRIFLQTSDWGNSRNSIYEAARGTYIRFGVHPLRPDAQMDMRLYDQETHKLYPARLIDVLKPVLQNILRWGAQGIAVDSACITAARLIDLHRQRTSKVYNSFQSVPLQLDRLDPVIAKPSAQECKEFAKIIELFEPILLQYFIHLVKVDGLPVDYQLAQQKHAVQPSQIGENSVDWQRKNIPAKLMLDLWEHTLPMPYNPRKACKEKSIDIGTYIPFRRQHDFESQPFTVQEGEVWPDNPAAELDVMFLQLLKSHMGVVEIVAQNSNRPEYHGAFCDLKRGEAALKAAEDIQQSDLSLLPGALGKNFAEQVRDANLEKIRKKMESLRFSGSSLSKRETLAFGTPVIAAINSLINRERPCLNGPGPNAVPSDYRLGFAMEMLKRNLTTLHLSNKWETSEDESRLMLLATKIEFGKVDRPGKNNTELKVFNEDGQYISFAARIKKLYSHLESISQSDDVRRAFVSGDADALKGHGVRYISLTLARLVEIYDCLRDQEYNAGRFEIRRVENLKEFSQGLQSIDDLRDDIINQIQQKWCWLWQEDDFANLRQDYRDHWQRAHGLQARHAFVPDQHAIGVKNASGPR